MSEPRRDIRVFFDADIHADLKDFADVDGLTMADLLEQMIVPLVRQRRNEVMRLAGKFRRRGISRDDPESTES